MKKYELLKPFSFLKKGDEAYVIFETKRVWELRNFAKIFTQDRIYVGEMEVSVQDEWLKETIKSKSVFDLGIGDEYYSINRDGFHRCIERRKIDCDYDVEFYRDRLFYGNIFSTEAEARKELSRDIAIQKIKKYCWENNIKTDYRRIERNNTFFSDKEGKIKFISDFKNGNPIGYFSEEDAEKILEKFEDELKIILDI